VPPMSFFPCSDFGPPSLRVFVCSVIRKAVLYLITLFTLCGVSLPACSGLALLHTCDFLSIEDLLPSFPDIVVIDEFKVGFGRWQQAVVWGMGWCWLGRGSGVWCVWDISLTLST
jgi:hypothetical protein